MVKAVWNNATIAESEDTVIVEGNHYFPLESVDPAVLRPSTTTSRCPWKGIASWFYPTPSAAAAEIAGRVAFWKGVKVG